MTSHAGFFASKLTVGTRARTTAREVYSMAYGYSGYYYYMCSSTESSRFSVEKAGQVK